MGSQLKEVEFIKDFANRKAGESFQCDGMLATNLIKRKVAKLKTIKKIKKNEKDT